MPQHDLSTVMGNFSIKDWISEQKIAQHYQSFLVKPVARFFAEKSVSVNEKDKETIISNLTSILEYDLKAWTFNLPTICAVAYVCLTLMGSLSVMKASILILGCYVVREIANQSLPLTESASVSEKLGCLTAYFYNVAQNKNWQSDYLSWTDFCILKNPSIPLNEQFWLVKRMIFG